MPALRLSACKPINPADSEEGYRQTSRHDEKVTLDGPLVAHSLMKTYTEIPDTSDNEYWQIKPNDGQIRSTTFIPRDKELHQQLKVLAWAIIQAAQPRRKRNAKD
jgi:hypothetical protein